MPGSPPRVRGTAIQILTLLGVLGSPPRVRGTGFPHRLSSAQARITPACAGNSCWRPFPSLPWTDHPRVCGEQMKKYTIEDFDKGSPPRVRGTDLCENKGKIKDRITPACAGNSTRPRYTAPRAPDHPRVCGEQAFLRGFLPGRIGSPPRVRGTVQAATRRNPPQGITPACAGNSVPVTDHVIPFWDHPRVCGEQLLFQH